MLPDITASDLCFVIAVHNRREFTRNCLLCLSSQGAPGARIVVVDDGSSDGTTEMIESAFPGVIVIPGDGNLWWSGATNAGIEVALELRAKYVVCLNDDTQPPSDFVEQLAAAASRMPDTIIGALAIDARTGRPLFGGERMNWLTAAPHPMLPKRGSPLPEVVEVTHAPGRGLLIPAAVFHKIGRFDATRFPQYAGDYDFTHRARRAGFRIVCDYRVKLTMYPDASGDASNRACKSFANYKQHLFGMRGGGNLRVFLTYSWRNCPRGLLPFCLAAGSARRIGGYPLEWMRERVTGWRRIDAGNEA